MKAYCRDTVALAFCLFATDMLGGSGSAFAAGPQSIPSFDRFTATDLTLKNYGFPPRPSRLTAKLAFAAWARLTSPVITRIKPLLEVTSRTHFQMSTGGFPKKSSASYSTNWSGYAISAPVSQFGSSSQYATFDEFNVPIAVDPFGTCPAGAYSSVWTGLDGVGTRDVVQAGAEADIFCNAGSRATSYYVWLEWFPGLEMKVSNFPISPGDVIEEEVWVTSPTAAWALILDETKNTETQVGVSAPAGIAFTGASAEWVVEAPTLGNGQTSLTNYTKVFSDENVSLLNNASHTALYPGWLAQGFTLSQYTMVDSYGHVISQAALDGPYSLTFSVEGSAR